MTEETVTAPTVNTDVIQKRSRPRLEAIAFADYASITTYGKADICGIFDRFLIEPEKKTTGFFYLYIRTAEITHGEIEISIFDPAGYLLGTGTSEIEESGNALTRRVTLVQRMSLDVTAEGEYWFDVSYQGQSLGGASVFVEHTKKESNYDSDSE